MAYPTAPSSATYQALEWILGTPANVRVLRVLALHQNQMAATTIAEQARLSRAGAWKALKELTAAGIIQTAGLARSVLYSLDRNHPFSPAIIALFSAEQQRLQKFFNVVHSVAGKLSPRVTAVWLFGSVARGEDEPQSDIDVAVLINAARDRQVINEFRQILEIHSAKLRLRPSVISFTRQELRNLPLERPDFWESFARDAMVLLGESPDSYV